MKKATLIFGCISSFLGLVMVFIARIEMASNSRYTWTRPYSSYEAGFVLLQMIGILFLVWGVVDVLTYLFSVKYTSNKIQDVNTISIIKCPKCGISLDSKTKICPKCKTIIKENKNENNN